MRQTKVMSVFDGVEMQKYFLYMTKQAEEAAYQAMSESINHNMELEDFMNEVKSIPQLKNMIQEMILYSISNIDWDVSMRIALENK